MIPAGVAAEFVKGVALGQSQQLEAFGLCFRAEQFDGALNHLAQFKVEYERPEHEFTMFRILATITATAALGGVV